MERAVNFLLMKVSGWAATDKEAMRLVNSWLRESNEVAGVKALAAYLGCSYQTVYRMMKYEGTPLTLAQFKAVCQYFGKDPVAEILKIFSRTSDEGYQPSKLSQWEGRQMDKVKLADTLIRAVKDFNTSERPGKADPAAMDDV